MSSFTEKTIKITAFLRDGEFSSGGNTVTFEGLPVSVAVSKPGGAEMNKASIVVNNLALDTMKQLTMLGFRKLQTYNNVIKVEAGTKGQKLSTVFEGEISSAVPVLEDGGSAVFQIEAKAGFYANHLPSPPVSVQGETTVEKLMKQFAADAGYSFENRGIKASVSNCVFEGSPILKARTLARQAGVDLLIDDRKIIIQPYERERTGDIILLSEKSGLCGYPTFSSDGIDVKAFYNSSFELGGFFELQTILPHASGFWKISKLEHVLEANKPSGGDWFTKISGVWANG